MGSHSQVRNKFKQAAQCHIPSFYGLINIPAKEISSKVALALLKGNYCAKSYGQTQTGLYEHPCIAAVINKAYFIGDKSDGYAHFQSFTPKMPVAMTCLAIIAVCYYSLNYPKTHEIPPSPPQIKAALSEYSTGIFKAAKFSGKVWSQEYDAEVLNWKFWANKDHAHKMTAQRVLTSLSELTS
jgi:Domain of unknown function (DUF6532)